MSKLYKANHFKPLSQLKLLGEFAKIWFGKNFPVAVFSNAVFVLSIKRITLTRLFKNIDVGSFAFLQC